MSRADRQRWEARYEKVGSVGDEAPSTNIAWLDPVADTTLVALDLACGGGRNTRELGRLGYHVVGVDISRSALKATARNAPVGRSPYLVQADMDAWPFAPDSFDVIVQIDFLDRCLVADLRASVKPGGFALVDTFAGPAGPDDPGPRRAEYRVEYGELRRRFADWDIVHCVETPPPRGRSAVLVRRPTPSPFAALTS